MGLNVSYAFAHKKIVALIKQQEAKGGRPRVCIGSGGTQLRLFGDWKGGREHSGGKHRAAMAPTPWGQDETRSHVGHRGHHRPQDQAPRPPLAPPPVSPQAKPPSSRWS